MHKTHLGDTVYAEIANGTTKLTTDIGSGVNNAIFLEPQVFAELVKYEKRIKEMYTKQPQ